MRNGLKGYNRIITVSLIVLGTMSLVGCGFRKPVSRILFNMDTVMDITIYGETEELDKVEELIESLDKKFSVTNPDSEIYSINQHKETSLSDETLEAIRIACDLSESTAGAMDISIYPIVKAWGFTEDVKQVPDDGRVRELLGLVDYKKVSENAKTNRICLPESMEIDLGCIAKGYTGDKVLELLAKEGVKSAIINLGGNVQTLGSKPDGSSWSVAIADPFDSTKYIGAVSVKNKSVITSGAYQRFFEENGVIFHHIIDPETGYPANSGLKSVTVIGEQGAVCDALSTAFYVMGLEKMTSWLSENERIYGVDVVVVDDDGVIHITTGIEDSFKALDAQKMVIIK